jgi:hypothetical protein
VQRSSTSASGGGEVERRGLQVQHAPSAGRHFDVACPIDERRCQQIARAAAAEVADRRARVGERQVDEAVAAENQIGRRQIGRVKSAHTNLRAGVPYRRAFSAISAPTMSTPVYGRSRTSSTSCIQLKSPHGASRIDVTPRASSSATRASRKSAPRAFVDPGPETLSSLSHGVGVENAGEGRPLRA